MLFFNMGARLTAIRCQRVKDDIKTYQITNFQTSRNTFQMLELLQNVMLLFPSSPICPRLGLRRLVN